MKRKILISGIIVVLVAFVAVGIFGCQRKSMSVPMKESMPTYSEDLIKSEVFSGEKIIIENKETGEKALVIKEYFSKYSGISIDTWEWIDGKGETHTLTTKNFIEWRSEGVDLALKLIDPKYHPQSEDEVGPPPDVNARLIKHEFSGWTNDGVLWSCYREVARYKEEAAEKEREFI